MIKNKKHKREDWCKIAALLSGEEAKGGNLNDLISPEDERVVRCWNAASGSGMTRMPDIGKAWERVKDSAGDQKPVKKIRLYIPYMRVAAAILMLAALGIAGLYLSQTLKTKQIIVATTGEETNKEVVLPDGSILWLNNNTKVSYLPGFRGDLRKVTISGEGFFNVIHDSDRPFVVEAGDATVKVTGTSFNVINDRKPGAVEVFVESGSVLLSISTGEGLKLEPGYIGLLSDNTLQKSLNNNRNYMAWRTGLLVYENAALRDVLADIAKIHGIEVTVEDPAILDKRITTTFDHDPAETIVNVICITFNMRYVKDGNNFRLLPE